jgi:hypothetical protein
MQADAAKCASPRAIGIFLARAITVSEKKSKLWQNEHFVF